MTSEADDAETTETTRIYELACTDCTFESTVNGSFFDALDVADSHQEEHGKTPREHFVNFELHGHEG